MQTTLAEEFSIEVINKSNVGYEKIDILISPVGFGAAYGRIRLRETGEQQEPQIFKYQAKYPTLPLTGLGLPPALNQCNLGMFVVATPNKPTGILQATFDKIIAWDPTMIEEDQIIASPGMSPMRGIRPPGTIRIVITGGSHPGIEAEFVENAD